MGSSRLARQLSPHFVLEPLPGGQPSFTKLNAAAVPFPCNDKASHRKINDSGALAAGEFELAAASLEKESRRNQLDGEDLLQVGNRDVRSSKEETVQLRYETAGKQEGFGAGPSSLMQSPLKEPRRKHTRATEPLHRAPKSNPLENVQRCLAHFGKLALGAKGA